MRKRRLFWQVMIAYLVVTVLSVVLVVVHALRSGRAFYLRHLADDLGARSILVADCVKDSAGLRSAVSIDADCKRLGQAMDARLTVIATDGHVMGDSHRDPAQMDNHADRPEVRDALRSGTGRSVRYSQTLRQNMMYVGYGVRHDGRNVGVVRVALSLSTIDAMLRANTVGIGLMAAAICMFAALLAWVLARRICDPLETMKRGAESLAEGDLAARMHVQGSYEMVSLAESLNRMADQLEQRMADQQTQRNERDAVFASMAEGVIAVDLEEKVIHLNRAAARLLQASRDSARGRSFQEVVRNHDLQSFAREAVKSGTPIAREIVLPMTAGTESQRLQAHGTVLRGANGERMGALVVLNDITQLRHLETVRKDFVANVTHELKTPVTTIRGFVETLRDGAAEEPEQRDRFLDIVSRQVLRLENLIGDLLSLARLEHEGSVASVSLERQNVAPVLEQAVALCQPQADSREVSLVIECPAELEASINAPLLEQAILNLVNNAIKFSEPHGTVTIVTATDHEGTSITVSDEGSGIEPVHLPRLFERFYRVDAGRSRQQGGTGLGLSIVRHVALLHNGSVDVESTLGQGSAFVIRIPHMAS